MKVEASYFLQFSCCDWHKWEWGCKICKKSVVNQLRVALSASLGVNTIPWPFQSEEQAR